MNTGILSSDVNPTPAANWSAIIDAFKRNVLAGLDGIKNKNNTGCD